MTRQRSNCIRLNSIVARHQLMTFATIFLVAFGSAVNPRAEAAPIESIGVGEPYYINNFLAENDLVYVLEVDKRTGRVKVQYPGGAVDWVRAADLLTQSESQRSDVAEAVGTVAVIGGALWAIFDPDGFERAVTSKPSQSTPATTTPPDDTSVSPSSALPPVRISGVPFAPLVDGDWVDQGQDWVKWGENRLASELGRAVEIETVRTKVVPAYSTVQRSVVLAECVQKGRVGAYYILAVRGESTAAVLTGTGTPILEMNRKLGLSITNADTAKSYLKFFSSAIAAEKGIFLVLEPGMDALDEQALEEIDVNPIQSYSDVNGSWRVVADILHGDGVFSSVFRVHRDGIVEMVSDRHKRRLDFDYAVVMDGGRRLYVKSQ